MPSRKQRKRRAKERRHDYEYVYVDEEGQEVEVEQSALNTSDRRNGKKAAAPMRGGRKVDPPSWSKVGRRALIFGPLMFLAIRLLEKGEPVAASAARTLFLLAVFLPFSYMMDTFLYRSYQRRARKR